MMNGAIETATHQFLIAQHPTAFVVPQILQQLQVFLGQRVAVPPMCMLPNQEWINGATLIALHSVLHRIVFAINENHY